jgi:hypothetical protein
VELVCNKSGYGIGVKIWGRDHGIPRIVHIGVGYKKSLEWGRSKKEADWLCQLWEGDRGEIHKEKGVGRL